MKSIKLQLLFTQGIQVHQQTLESQNGGLFYAELAKQMVKMSPHLAK